MKMQNLSAKLGARLQKRTQRGFTLVEIAIVLLIIGLLLGGILRGQEIITNARVRNLLDTKEGIKAAIYSFRDRYAGGAMLPGDIVGNQATQLGVVAGSANDGQIVAVESPTLFQNLALKGLIDCNQCLTHVVTSAAPSAANSPVNHWGGVMWVGSAAVAAAPVLGTGAAQYMGAGVRNRLMLSVGGVSPEINLILDGKTDNLNPTTGDFRFAVVDVNPPMNIGAACVNGAVGDAAVRWLNENDQNRGNACSGAWFID